MRQLDLFLTEACPTRIEPSANMQRYHVLQITPDLFGGYALSQSWDRNCTARIELYDTESAAISALASWRGRKRRWGCG